MNQLLKTAEAYYEVARDLDYQIQEMTKIRNFLNRAADALCEANAAITTYQEDTAHGQDISNNSPAP